MINEGLPLYLVARLEQQHDLSAMTVGILGMAFKAESDDTRSSLSYKLKRLLAVQGRPGALHRPVRAARPRPLAARRRARRVRPARHRRTAPALRRPRYRRARHRHVEPARAGRARVTPARLGRHPRLQRGRGDRPVPRPALRVRSPCRARCSRSTTRPTTRRGPTSRSTPAPSRASCRRSTPTDAGPARALRYGLEHATRRRHRRDHGRRQRRPAADRRSSPTSSSGAWWSPPPSRYMQGGQQVGGAVRSSRSLSRVAGAVALLVRPGRHARRHQLVQGLRPPVRRAGRHRVRRRASSSGSSWSPRPAATGCRSPRSRRSGSTGRWPVELQGARRGSRGTCAGTATPSARG